MVCRLSFSAAKPGSLLRQEPEVAKFCLKSFYIRIQVGGFGLQHFILYRVLFMVRLRGVLHGPSIKLKSVKELN